MTFCKISSSRGGG